MISASSAAAWIGFAGGVIAAVLSTFVGLRARVNERLTRLKSELDAEVHARAVLLDRDLRAEETLARQREPLAAAAFDLQSRLYNILRQEFFAIWGDGERGDDAVRTTLFRLAQYFGWSEILRRDIQFLAFPEDEATRRVAELQSQITACFLSHSYGTAMMIWRDEQRAIGERMIVEEHNRVLCMGYASFRERCEEVFGAWARRMPADLEDETAQTRLREVQHRLCELVETLDQRRVRYTAGLDRAQLSGGHGRPVGAGVFCPMLEIGPCNYEADLRPLSSRPELTADSPVAALNAEKHAQEDLLDQLP